MPSSRRPEPLDILLLLVLALAPACAGAKSSTKGEPYQQPDPPAKDPFGYFLVQYDKGLQRWSELKLNPQAARDETTLRALEQNLRRVARERQQELVHELESGSPKNREVAVVALGFTGDPAALGPILGALNDPSPSIEQKALLALGILGLPETPLDPIADQLAHSEDPWTRNNAAFALHRLIQNGARSPGLREVLTRGLADPEPGVRAQTASGLGLLAEPEALPALGPALVDLTPLVSRAAASAVGAIARAHPEAQGEAARMLVDALDRVQTEQRAPLIEELVHLRGQDLGERTVAWREWAAHLP